MLGGGRVNGLIYFTAAADGSLCEVIPIEDELYKRLQLLQGQLSRNVQQVAGLNAKAFRYEAWQLCVIVTDRFCKIVVAGRCRTTL